MIMGEMGFDENPFLFHKDDYEDRDLQVCGGFLEEFEILDEINGGSFGVVYSARDKKSKEMVAIKEEVHGFSPSTLMEINILKTLPPHPNIVQFKGAATVGHHVFVVMELLKFDLQRLRPVKGRPFSLVEIKYIMIEITKGVRFLHENGVMHRDLKPANILVGDNNSVKICDFGLSGSIGWESRGVGTRFYKAPEVIAGSSSYTGAIDMWSVGCIMAELVLDKPLFRGTSDAHQLGCIRELLCGESNLLRLRMATDASFSGATALTHLGIDLLERLLAYHPSNRISAANALNHPWFTEYPLPPN